MDKIEIIRQIENRFNNCSEHIDLTDEIDAVNAYINNNPNDIQAYSLLAILKLENTFETDIELLDNLCHRNDISAADEAMLQTNLAYLLSDTGDSDNREQAMKLLQTAAKNESPYPQTYYGLASFYYEKKEYNNALACMRKAAAMMQNKPMFCESLAACMIKCKRYNEAEDLLHDLPQTDFVHYLSAIIAVNKRDYTAVYAHINNIDIHSFEDGDIEDLFFAVNDFQKYIETVERDSRYTVALHDEYAYALYQTGNEEKLDKLIADELQLYQDNIKETTPDEYEDIEDYNNFIECCKKNIDYVSSLKIKIVNGFCPDAQFSIRHPDFCFYIGCPRHSERWKIT